MEPISSQNEDYTRVLIANELDSGKLALVSGKALVLSKEQLSQAQSKPALVRKLTEQAEEADFKAVIWVARSRKELEEALARQNCPNIKIIEVLPTAMLATLTGEQIAKINEFLFSSDSHWSL